MAQEIKYSQHLGSHHSGLWIQPNRAPAYQATSPSRLRLPNLELDKKTIPPNTVVLVAPL